MMIATEVHQLYSKLVSYKDQVLLVRLTNGEMLMGFLTEVDPVGTFTLRQYDVNSGDYIGDLITPIANIYRFRVGGFDLDTYRLEVQYNRESAQDREQISDQTKAR